MGKMDKEDKSQSFHVGMENRTLCFSHFIFCVEPVSF